MRVHAIAGWGPTWCCVLAWWSEAGGGLAHVAFWTLQWHRLSPRRSTADANLFCVFTEALVGIFSAACNCEKLHLMQACMQPACSRMSCMTAGTEQLLSQSCRS